MFLRNTIRVSFSWRGLAGVWVRRALAQGEAYVSAEPERERGYGVADSVPDDAHAPAKPRLGISHDSISQSKFARHFLLLLFCDEDVEVAFGLHGGGFGFGGLARAPEEIYPAGAPYGGACVVRGHKTGEIFKG